MSALVTQASQPASFVPTWADHLGFPTAMRSDAVPTRWVPSVDPRESRVRDMTEADSEDDSGQDWVQTVRVFDKWRQMMSFQTV